MPKEWQEKLRKIDPYVPGEQSAAPDLIKLNANENPYPPSPRVREAIHGFQTDALRLYPDANAACLRNALAAHHGLSPAQVFVGNGSDDVLALAFQSFFCSAQPVLFPDITYSFYPVWCALFGTKYETVPLDADFRVNPRDYDRPCGGVIIPNPNAPTGIAQGRAMLEDILSHNQDCVVIIDEAYVDFGGWSCIPLLQKYENLLIVHTFSKSRSLAGLRIGAAFGSETLIATLEAVKNSYNSYTLDAVSLAAGAASVQDDAYFRETCAKIIATRARCAQALTGLGFTVCPSDANFLFVTHPLMPARDIFAALRAQNIFIRHFNLPRIENHLRITIGTDEEMDKLLAALTKLL